MRLFDQDGDYRSWFRAFARAQERVPVQVFAYCLMPNHFHLVLRPREDGHLAEFMRLGTVTHSMRWHRYRGSAGTGPVYQGRYRAFPVQTNHYFYNVCRYVEANPLRAALVARAEEWPWSSLSARCRNCHDLGLSDWPIVQPPDWTTQVNQRGSNDDIDVVRRCIKKTVPLGDSDWIRRTADPLGLIKGFREAGRPRKIRPGLI